MIENTAQSLGPTESFSERYGFDSSSIDSLTVSEIGRGTGAVVWRDVKVLFEPTEDKGSRQAES